MFEEITGKEPHPVLGLPSAEQLAGLSDVQQKELWEFRRRSLIGEKLDPLRHGFEPEVWKEADRLLKTFREENPIGPILFIVLGGIRACLVEGSEIYDPMLNRYYRVEDIDCAHFVLAWDTEGERWEVAMADRPFRKGKLPCVKVTLENGQTFCCAADHLCLTASDSWLPASSLLGQSLLGLAESSVDVSQLVHASDAQSYVKKASGSAVGYPNDHRSHDERPQWVRASDRVSVPSQADGVAHSTFSETTFRSLLSADYGSQQDMKGAAERMIQHIHSYQPGFLHASWNALCHFALLLFDRQYRASCRLYESAWRLRENQGTPEDYQQSTAGFSHLESKNESLLRDKRSYYELPYRSNTTKVVSVQDIGEKECWDFHVPEYENYMHAGVCHHNSKTEWRCKRLVQNMLEKTGYVGWACHTTQTSSFDAQQKKIYRYIPAEVKNPSGRNTRGTQLKVNYTPWGGFTTDNFALPSGNGETSLCLFKFYGIDPRALEGSEIDEGWMDEEAPPEWLDALLDRAVTRNGTVYLTFTAKNGYTSLLRAILSGARTITEVEAELLPIKDALGNITGYEKVPKVQVNDQVALTTGEEGRNRTTFKAVIIYFHTKDNPYGNYEGLKKRLEGASRDTILTRAYGIPTKSMEAKFPMFRDSVHVVSLNRFYEIQKGGGIWYHFLDPCSGRNWFQIWIFIDRINRAFVAGESPSYGHRSAYIPGVGDPGPWAVAGAKADGEQGDGQKEWGWGYTRYLEEIDRMERILGGGGCMKGAEDGISSDCVLSPLAQKISISARWVDSRYGNARKTTEERSVTMIEELSDLGMDFLAAPTEKYIDSGRGGGDGSLRMINDRLFYDTQKEVDLTNSPKLFVVETCPNTIYALKEWTGNDGQHGASKDPVDCLRMFVPSGCEYVDSSLLQPRTPWLKQFAR